jgi:hypothetical protein
MAKGKKTGGRKKGSTNKVTVAVKDALTQAFSLMGGVKALAAWGKDNPELFYPIWSKLLPQEVKAEHTGPDGGPISHEHTGTIAAKLDALSAAYAGAAAREEAAAPGTDGTQKPVDT